MYSLTTTDHTSALGYLVGGHHRPSVTPSLRRCTLTLPPSLLSLRRIWISPPFRLRATHELHDHDHKHHHRDHHHHGHGHWNRYGAEADLNAAQRAVLRINPKSFTYWWMHNRVEGRGQGLMEAGNKFHIRAL